MTAAIIRQQKGFTLVELAIVLVIIGLIVASVLVGQDLIKSAELRATARQYQTFQTAVSTFINKYEKIPGDIDGDAFGLTGGCDDPTTNGDGDQDGIIEDAAGANGSSTTLDQDGEILCFWANLTTAGKELIPGTYDGTAASSVINQHIPAMKFGSRGWGVYGTTANTNYFVAGVIGGTNAFDTAAIFIPIDAFNIDSKVDDGVPASGKIVAIVEETGDSAAPNTTDIGEGPAVATSCYDHNQTPVAYHYSATAANCALRFDMDTF